MTKKERQDKRNQAIRASFKNLSKNRPQWRYKAVVEELANSFFLAPRTVEAILRKEGNY